MSRERDLADGRQALQRRQWRAAYEGFSAADRAAALDLNDLESLAGAALLIGNDDEVAELLGRAHQGYLVASDPAGAARCAFRIGIRLFTSGATAQGSGWFSRARRILDDAGLDCVERGYLLLPEGMLFHRQKDAESALATFASATAIGTRYRDRDLIAFGLMGQGRSLLGGGDPARGAALLDEAMVAVTAGDVSPEIAGILYCSVIDACSEIFDLRRAHEWTAALNAWCESQPDLVPYRGTCLVHRAELLQLHGDWGDALKQAEQAGEQLVPPWVGAAFYRLGELHRLRGEFVPAEAAYRQASEVGHQPEPGLALLRLAQGETATALAATRRLMDETRGRNRSPVLAACVEIALAAGDIAVANTAVMELGEIAARLHTPFLDAVTAQAKGAVRLAEGEPREALALLRCAEKTWRELGAPYETARVRALLALACRAQGDTDAADLELAAARRAFEDLGARPDLINLDAMALPAASGAGTAPGGLSPRELEVLAQVASGGTNKAIAAALAISEKTVARHISNIFTKLGLSSRAAATAYAYRHKVVPPT